MMSETMSTTIAVKAAAAELPAPRVSHAELNLLGRLAGGRHNSETGGSFLGIAAAGTLLLHDLAEDMRRTAEQLTAITTKGVTATATVSLDQAAAAGLATACGAAVTAAVQSLLAPVTSALTQYGTSIAALQTQAAGTAQHMEALHAGLASVQTHLHRLEEKSEQLGRDFQALKAGADWHKLSDRLTALDKHVKHIDATVAETTRTHAAKTIK